MTDQNPQPEQPKPTTSKLAKAAILCLIVTTVLFVLLQTLRQKGLYNGRHSEMLGFILLLFGLIVPPLLAIAWLFKTCKAKSQLRGLSIALFAIILSLIFAIWALPQVNKHGHWHTLTVRLCQSNLRRIGMALTIYAQDNNDMIPTPDKWCDLLLPYLRPDLERLVCKNSTAILGESSYALNENVAGCKLSEIPGDTVLVFETKYTPTGPRDFGISKRASAGQFLESSSAKVYKDRWNQVAGPNSVNLENHTGWTNILCAYGNIWTGKAAEIPSLRWSPSKPTPNDQQAMATAYSRVDLTDGINSAEAFTLANAYYNSLLNKSRRDRTFFNAIERPDTWEIETLDMIRPYHSFRTSILIDKPDGTVTSNNGPRITPPTSPAKGNNNATQQ